MKMFRQSDKKVLIIGKLPLPIGGVRVHVQRLIKDLDKRGYDKFIFHDLGQNPLWKVFAEIAKSGAVHLHTSNPWFQLVMAAYCRLLRKPVIITYHGNWGRHTALRNIAEAASAFVADVPVVQNKESLLRATKLNTDASLISTFIPPVSIIPLSETIYQQILNFKQPYRYLFCTNAWNVTFDNQGREIYGIARLIESISKSKQSALIISDPSGNYQNYIKNLCPKSAVNILWISQPHDFWNILKLSDAFVRNTTTDATSLSIQEAFCCDTVVFASDCVSRSPGCHLYHDIREFDFEKELEIILNKHSKLVQKPSYTETVDQLITLYERCIHST